MHMDEPDWLHSKDPNIELWRFKVHGRGPSAHSLGNGFYFKNKMIKNFPQAETATKSSHKLYNVTCYDRHVLL
jgi:hypothetical protein